MTRKTLALKRETLTELTAADLTRVAGAAPDASGLTCPFKDCTQNLSEQLSCYDSGCWGSCWCTSEPSC